MRILLILCFLATLGAVTAQAQGTVENAQFQQQARSELERRGIDETEFRKRLLERGIDIDNIPKERIPELQPVVEAVLREMEAEKQEAPPPAPQTPSPDLSAEQARSIQEKVKQGASVEEALSEMSRPADTLSPALVYGQHLFRDQNLALFRTTNEVKPPDSYILSAGDVLTVSIFGASQFDGRFEINREGYIQPSQMPKIFLKGVSLVQAKNLLRSRFSQFYAFAPEQFAVSLSTARSITVNIFGETNRYGSFTISAVNTAFNALVACGGPTALGTVRNIKVIRGKQSKRLDVYAFMNNPAIQYDFFLEDNDIIHVPVAERIVSLKGAVNRPFLYELSNGEQLKKLLEFAGGLSAKAHRDFLQIRRFENDKQVLIDVSLQAILEGGQDFSLRNGDEIIVRSITTDVRNTVNISGAVAQPGNYAVTETPRVSDLLKKALLLKEARTDMAFLLRANPNENKRLIQLNLASILAAPGAEIDLLLEAQDEIIVYTQERYADKNTFSVIGAVRDTLIQFPYPVDSSVTLQRAILLAGGLGPDANGSGLIRRVHPGNENDIQYINVNLMAALRNPNSPDNIRIQAEDKIIVLSQRTFSDAAGIQVSGAVRQPGEFEYGRNMTLRDAILLAGGFKLEAARNRIDIYRVEMRENQPTKTVLATIQVDSTFLQPGQNGISYPLMPFDEIVVRSVPEFEFQRFVTISGEVRYPGKYALINSNERLSDIIQRAGGFTQEAFVEGSYLIRNEGKRGYIITDFAEAVSNKQSPHNHILQQGDLINVPKKEDMVSIRVAYTRALDAYQGQLLLDGLLHASFRPGKRAGWYIRNYAGGFGKYAYKRKVSVLQANGKINRTVQIGFLRFYPKVQKGSTVSVGGKIPKAKSEVKKDKTFDWDKAFTQILATTTAFATIILAISALNN